MAFFVNQALLFFWAVLYFGSPLENILTLLQCLVFHLFLIAIKANLTLPY